MEKEEEILSYLMKQRGVKKNKLLNKGYGNDSHIEGPHEYNNGIFIESCH